MAPDCEGRRVSLVPRTSALALTAPTWFPGLDRRFQRLSREVGRVGETLRCRLYQGPDVLLVKFFGEILQALVEPDQSPEKSAIVGTLWRGHEVIFKAECRQTGFDKLPTHLLADGMSLCFCAVEFSTPTPDDLRSQLAVGEPCGLQGGKGAFGGSHLHLV